MKIRLTVAFYAVYLRRFRRLFYANVLRIKIKVNARMLNASHFEFVFDLFMSVQRVGTSCGNKTANHFEPDGIHGQTAVISPIAMRAKEVERGQPKMHRCICLICLVIAHRADMQAHIHKHLCWYSFAFRIKVFWIFKKEQEKKLNGTKRRELYIDLR